MHQQNKSGAEIKKYLYASLFKKKNTFSTHKYKPEHLLSAVVLEMYKSVQLIKTFILT